jgi:hypothetical protein
VMCARDSSVEGGVAMKIEQDGLNRRLVLSTVYGWKNRRW